MMNGISPPMTSCLLLIAIVSFSFQTATSEVIGDVDGNGIVGMEEAIYALQVAAGMKPDANAGQYSGPQYSAWGQYTYLPSSGALTLSFAFSNFAKKGPPPGFDYNTTVQSISSTEMIVTLGSQQTYTRNSGTAGVIVGRWEHKDTDNNTSSLVIKSDGSFVYSVYGNSYTEIIDVPQRTISVNGDFSDWDGLTQMNLYWTEGDCGNAPGREIQEVYIAQDDNYVYLRMKLNGSPDPTFDFKFGEFPHIRVSPPPNPGIYIKYGL